MLAHIGHGKFDVVINGLYQQDTEPLLVDMCRGVFSDAIRNRVEKLETEFEKL